MYRSDYNADTLTIEKVGEYAAFKSAVAIAIKSGLGDQLLPWRMPALSVADLKPETSESWGSAFITGAKKAYWRGVEASVTTFRNDVDNRIGISRTPDVTPRPAIPTCRFQGKPTVRDGVPVFRYYNVKE